MGVSCARKSQHRAQRCAAQLNNMHNKLCMRFQHACMRRQVTRESEGLSRAAEEALRRAAYAELQRKHRAARRQRGGDNEEAREAAGKAALLRAKALHSKTPTSTASADGTPLYVGTRVQTQWTREEGGDDRWYAGSVSAVLASGEVMNSGKLYAGVVHATGPESRDSRQTVNPEKRNVTTGTRLKS